MYIVLVPIWYLSKCSLMGATPLTHSDILIFFFYLAILLDYTKYINSLPSLASPADNICKQFGSRSGPTDALFGHMKNSKHMSMD